MIKMKKYELKLTEKIRTEFDKESNDYSGKETVTPMNFPIIFETEKLTVESVLKTINFTFGTDLTSSDMNCSNGIYGSLTVTETGENDESVPICLTDFYFTVSPVSEPINLEELFS